MYNIKEKTKEMASFVIGISSDMFKEFDHDDEINFLNQALNLQELRECYVGKKNIKIIK